MLSFILQFAHSQKIRPYDLEMQAKHAEDKGYDPTYRVNYFENIIIRSTFSSNIYNLQFRNASSGNTIDLRPVTENLIGVSLDYKWIAVGFSFSPNFLIDAEEEELIENSQTLKFDLNFFYSDQWRQELSYVYNRGFNVEANFDLSEPNLNAFRDTELQVFMGSTYFIANKNYSFRAHYAQTERQLRSAGSFIPRLSYSYSITTPTLTNFNESNSTTKLRSFDIIASFGYLYTFVHNQKWLASIGAHPGIGYNYAAYEYNNNTEAFFSSGSFAFKSEITLGYNSYRWFFGLNGFWQNFNNSNNENNEINSDSLFFMAYMGYRFNDNKPMRKFFGWFEDTFGF